MHDPELARLSRETEARVIGQRIKNARIAAGLTQEELGEPEASGAYISRIEAGNRRAGMALLAHVAEKLGTSIDQLVADEAADPTLRLSLSLDYAELACKSGDPDAAIEGVRDVLDGADPRSTAPLVLRARTIRASALEAKGDYTRAIQELERLVADRPRDLAWIGNVMTLSVCYRRTGDHARAIEVGTEAAGEIDALGLAGTEEAIRLSLTVSTAHLERGEIHQALRLCERAVEDAEEIGSEVALASAYWNSSIVRDVQGDLPGAALLAQRAIRSFESGTDARALAMLRHMLATIQLRLSPPDVDSAEANVEKVLQDGWSSLSMVLQEDLRMTLATVHLARGRREQAREAALTALAAVEDVSPYAASDACVILGRIALADGQKEEAVSYFQRAALLLSSCGADHWVAQCWFDLGTLLEQVGEEAAAVDAFRRSAASTGLTMPNPTSLRV